jgi:hypothetical protein
MVSFDISKADADLVSQIVDRAKRAALVASKGTKHWYKPIDLRMDLTAVHANGNPLDFARLLAADDFNFTHDIAGIPRHIDRETGRLTNFFRPRFSSRKKETA